ncbi:MAG TPA: zinc ribbon domain-containing protein [Spirochaetota bacterium]|nr:zinc ribbon domain-containing protein [Spirochaetota bacterium]HPJ33739.1 zinc ribbon domain-containing protein [Spirochaetota bacterium]
MPMYEFKCRECGNIFSELRKMGDFKAICPECKSDQTEKLISAFSSPSTAGKCAPSGGG